MQEEKVNVVKNEVRLKIPTERGGLAKPHKKPKIDTHAPKQDQEEKEITNAQKDIETTKEEKSKTRLIDDKEVNKQEDAIISSLPTTTLSSQSLKRIVNVGTPKFFEASAMSIVHSTNNGNRVTFGAEVMKSIENPKSVNVFLIENEVILMAASENDKSSFRLRKSGNKSVIYSKPLVKEIIDSFDLVFENKVSYSCYDVKYELLDDQPIARISINSKEEF